MENIEFLPTSFENEVSVLILSEDPQIRALTIEFLTAVVNGEDIKGHWEGDILTITFPDPMQAETYRKFLGK